MYVGFFLKFPLERGQISEKSEVFFRDRRCPGLVEGGGFGAGFTLSQELLRSNLSYPEPCRAHPFQKGN